MTVRDKVNVEILFVGVMNAHTGVHECQIGGVVSCIGF